MHAKLIRGLLVVAISFAAASPSDFSRAQDRHDVPVIGLLAVSAAADDAMYGGLREGLRDLGYIEGQHYRLVHRGAQGDSRRLGRLAHELGRLNVRVIITAADEATRAAKESTSSVPIVTAIFEQDPVQAGFVASLSRPGGNVTGLYTANDQLAAKRLEFLKEVLPTLGKVGVLWDSHSHTELAALEPAARDMDIHIERIEVGSSQDINAVMKLAKRQKCGAVIVPATSPALYVNNARIAASALANGLPLIGESRTLARSGGLMSYSTDPRDAMYRVAYFIDRVLKGVKVSELPVEETTRIALVVNLRVAKTLRLHVPQSILLRADEIITVSDREVMPNSRLRRSVEGTSSELKIS
jgi:putative tryptophan/tyrosine transport system substrate-binding protein